MDDFTSKDERKFFREIPFQIPPTEQIPFREHDAYFHGCYLSDIDVPPVDFGEMMARFTRTFMPSSLAAGGGLSLTEKGKREIMKNRKILKKKGS